MLTLPGVFQDHMMLQRNKPVTVWGTANPNGFVVVSIQGKHSSARVDTDGNFEVVLPSLQPSLDETLVISDGKTKYVFRDVAIGDVWLAGGQSNMEYLMRYDAEREHEAGNLPDPIPEIRYYEAPKECYPGALRDRDFHEYGIWRILDRKNLDWFSAVSYYFLRKVYAETGVPQGVVSCDWGGSRACCWIPEETLLESGGSVWLEEYREGLGSIPDLDVAVDEWKHNMVATAIHPFDDPVMYPGRTREEQLHEMEVAPYVPQPLLPVDPWRPCGLYHTMLEPLMPFSFAGILYYQGESDAQHAECYAGILTGLIQKWRTDFRQDLPFLMVQLAPFGAWYQETGERYPEIRRAQQNVADTVPGVYLASNGDAGMRWDIHPKHKRPVGERLALLTLQQEAPRATGCNWATSTTFEISFVHADGLHWSSDDRSCLAVTPQPEETRLAAGCLQFQWKKPPEHVQVAFAQTSYYEINLYNGAGIPALPFAFEC